MVQIIPSILIKTEKEFLDQTKAVSECLSMIQLDIADGQFVPNTTWAADPEVVSENLEIDCELHLMINNPLEEMQKWEFVDQVKRVLVHYESVENIAEVIGRVSSYGWEVGLVLNPPTPINVIDDLIEELDSIMFMGVNPGYQGQKFIPETLERIKKTREKYPNLFIELDGAVNMETLPEIVKSGVNAICPGSAIFGNECEPAENVEKMRELINTIIN